MRLRFIGPGSIVRLAVVLAALCGGGTFALAETAGTPPVEPMAANSLGAPKPVGTFQAWQALTYEEKGLLMCYTISRPGTILGKLANRGEVGALVTRVADAQAANGGDEVSIVLGFEPKKGNPVLVKIGKKSFRLTKVAPQGPTARAWATDAAQDRQMVEAMKHADWMVVNATSAAKGNVKTQDTYALAGFGKAYAAMTDACR